jgi:hypothetical protein
MELMQAHDIVSGAQGKVLDYYDWQLDASDSGMLHLLHCDIPSASRKHSTDVDVEEDDEEEYAVLSATDTATSTRSKSTIVLASTYVRAMYTAVVVLGREAHPRSILCPLTSTEWECLVTGYGVPENLLQGNKVTPRFNYAKCGGADANVNPDWEFLKYRSAQPFFRDLYTGQVHFAVRAMTLARLNKPGASLAALHRECHRVVLATKPSTRAGFDHALTIVNCLLQHSRDLFEPDAAAIVAIQAFRPGASINTTADNGRMLQAEVRRQLNLYHKELLAVSRRRRNTMAVTANLDSAGLDVKQAQGRLPKDTALITTMIAKLWQQVFQPVWTAVLEPWLQQQNRETSIQSYLLCDDFEGFAAFAEKQELTQQDVKNLRTLLQLDLSFLRSQVWLGSLVTEYKLIEHEGRRLYEFRTTRNFKTGGKAAANSLPSASRWPLSENASALVHTLLHLKSASNFIFPGSSLRAISEATYRTFKKLGCNWCGVPRLGPHCMRTYECCKAVNAPGVGVQDYPALASRMQVSLDTMTAVYAAQSMQGPAAQLAFRLHASERKEQSLCLEQTRQEKQHEQDPMSHKSKKQRGEYQQQVLSRQQGYVSVCLQLYDPTLLQTKYKSEHHIHAQLTGCVHALQQQQGTAATNKAKSCIWQQKGMCHCSEKDGTLSSDRRHYCSHCQWQKLLHTGLYGVLQL